ncbi:histidine kinase dimerization/phosphoacceptor domain -containing protein [Aliiroseovarius sp. PTFE2010]|uniref:histidine kinase dimerization/phosphoacceptor domain -containing protein n=1 Tax=Aliiroseovarius sp. PTFE2010 TaxID=3417190 RepID=UPI003CF42993
MTDSQSQVLESEERLHKLHALGLLDTPAEQDFDDIVQLASEICNVPMAMISLVDSDRQYFKAKVGLEASETPIEHSVCAYAMTYDDVLEIPDTRTDRRTADNPLVHDGDVDMKFYAGAPLQTEDGTPLGALCVLDRQPRQLNDFQKRALETLSRQVMVQIELRQMLREAEDAAENLRASLELQEVLRREIDHRVKNSLLQVTSLLRIQARRAKDENVRSALHEAENRISAIALIHAELYQAGSDETVSMARYIQRLTENLSATLPNGITLTCATSEAILPTQAATALAIVINEFVTNSVKYAFPDGTGSISISFQTDDNRLTVRIADDGIGLDECDVERAGGIGMMVMRASAAQIDAELTFEPSEKGTVVLVTVPMADDAG